MPEDDDFDPMDEDFLIIASAKDGDYGPLIELLRNGAELTSWRRELVIQILEGKLKRPSHRPARTVNDLSLKAKIHKRIRELTAEGHKLTAVDAQVADEFGCSVKTVSNIRQWVARGTDVDATYLWAYEPKEKK